MKYRVERDDKVKPTRAYSSKQESYVAKKLGGTLSSNSGATLFDKGDVKTELFCLECKTKMKSSESITIQKNWIEKNEKEAMFVGKPYSALVFNFGPDEKNYYVIDEYLFEELQEYLKHAD